MFNLGTGTGVSVLDLVKTFEKVTNTVVPFKITGRREGDISIMYADAKLAETELNWKAKHTLEEMCKILLSNLIKPYLQLIKFFYFYVIKYKFVGADFWRWQTMNPNGYRAKDTTKIQNGH